MKIILNSFYSDFNYGAVLQASSLNYYLLSLGHDAMFLKRAKPLKKQIFRSWKSPRSIFRNILILPNYLKMLSRAKKTEDFINKYQRHTNEGLPTCIYINDADIFITGSDQVWNVQNGLDPQFFLQYVKKSNAKLISYAASFGTDTIPQEYEEQVKKELQRFNMISVREKTAADIVEGLVSFRPNVVCDPVFLHDASFWKNAVSEYKKRPTRYIFVYGIRKDEHLEHCVEIVKQELGVPVVQALPGFNLWAVNSCDVKLHDLAPDEFIDLIMNADAICTNSFHGMCFSLLLNKPFFATKSTLGRGTRQINLLETFDELQRMIDKQENPLSKEKVKTLLYVDSKKWEQNCKDMCFCGRDFLAKALK